MFRSVRLTLFTTASLLAARAGAQSTPPIPDALVGVWKGTEVPGRSLDVMTGATVALIGWHAQLELGQDGRYNWTEYREGELGGCRISTLRKASGVASADGAVLVLGVAQGSEAKQDGCNRAASYSNHPVSIPVRRLSVKLAWAELTSGWETLQLTLTSTDGSSETLAFASEPHIEWPAANLGQPIPNQAIPSDLPSTWVWPDHTTRFTVPGPDAHWVHFGADGRYEWMGRKENLVPGPGCAVAVVAYERGRYRVAQGPYDWTMITEPDSASVLERRSGCGAEDGDRAIPVQPQPSRYSWSIGRTVDGAEVLEMKCASDPRERNRWQFLLCHWVVEFRSLFSRVRE